MANVAGVLRQPFKEQVAAFRARLGELAPTERWDDIEREAHDRAFMVAGAQKADLLAAFEAATKATCFSHCWHALQHCQVGLTTLPRPRIKQRSA